MTGAEGPGPGEVEADRRHPLAPDRRIGRPSLIPRAVAWAAVAFLAMLGVVTVFGGPLDEPFWDQGPDSTLWVGALVLAAGSGPSWAVAWAAGRPGWRGAAAFATLWVLGLVLALLSFPLGLSGGH